MSSSTVWSGKGKIPVNATCTFFSDSPPVSPENCNLDDHCIVDTWRNGDILKVIAHAEMSNIDPVILPVVQNLRTTEVSSILYEHIRPHTSEDKEELNAIKEIALPIMLGKKTAADNTQHALEILQMVDRLYNAGMIILPNGDHRS